MTRIYLDTCCFNRLFDDKTYAIIRLEAKAMLYVQEEIRRGNLELAWSFVLNRENAACPLENRRESIAPWKLLSIIDVEADEDVFQHGRAIEKFGIGTMDALHIACAIKARCRFFLTTDKKVLKKRIGGIAILNPLDFVQEMETGK